MAGSTVISSGHTLPAGQGPAQSADDCLRESREPRMPALQGNGYRLSTGAKGRIATLAPRISGDVLQSHGCVKVTSRHATPLMIADRLGFRLQASKFSWHGLSPSGHASRYTWKGKSGSVRLHTCLQMGMYLGTQKGHSVACALAYLACRRRDPHAGRRREHIGDCSSLRVDVASNRSYIRMNVCLKH
eukprot:4152770-Prymnesium_polylepis.2